MMIAGRCLIISMALIIAGCGGADEPRQSAKPPAASQKTADNVITISPDNPTVKSVITLNADTPLPPDASIAWYVNDETAESSGGMRFALSGIKKGSIIEAVVTANNKELHSNRLKIMNTPPIIKRAEMLPARPKSGEDIRIETDGYDVDGDIVHYRYRWTVNGNYITDQNYLRTDLKRDDILVVEIIPYDNEDIGGKILIKNRIFNSPPVAAGTTPVFDGKTYTYDLKASDVDRDELAYEIQDGPKGMSVDRNGVITWEAAPGDAGIHKFTVIVNDNKGGRLVIPITARIGFEENKPSN